MKRGLARYAGFDPMERPIGLGHPLCGRRPSRLTLAILGSTMAKNRVRRMKEDALRNPPTQIDLTQRFPYPARTQAEVPKRGRPGRDIP